MFGHKWDYDVCRKFESDASKRARKVEMEKKNKQLTGSFFNF
jgi:hypothetical protein